MKFEFSKLLKTDNLKITFRNMKKKKNTSCAERPTILLRIKRKKCMYNVHITIAWHIFNFWLLVWHICFDDIFVASLMLMSYSFLLLTELLVDISHDEIKMKIIILIIWRGESTTVISNFLIYSDFNKRNMNSCFLSAFNFINCRRYI